MLRQKRIKLVARTYVSPETKTIETITYYKPEDYGQESNQDK